MIKSIFPSATAALILAASSSFAAPYHPLWNQNTNFGGSVNSQNDTAAADDFIVPSSQIWRVAGVDVTGMYFNGSRPASSEDVTFYTDKEGKPDSIYAGPFTLACTDRDGSFRCILPHRVRMPPGTYWVSVVANCSFEGCGQWGWIENTTVQGGEAKWENPDGIRKCRSFKSLHLCFGGTPADLAFDLFGKAVSSN